MPSYNTRQRELLADYLSKHTDEKITARQIEDALHDDKISISAIYRNLAILEKDGQVKRCVGDGSREVYFQYIASNLCKNSIHLACRVCGKYFHLEQNCMNTLMKDVKHSNGFSIDTADSVLYGVCRDCGR